MEYILNIDTATEIATVSLSENERVLQSLTNNNQKDHASFLQPAIKKLLENEGLHIDKLNAVAVTSGPGSYTGLRVGLAAAKGLCYALNIPLITINTLEVMALSTIIKEKDGPALYCPMIDARRSEVFTAVYDYNLSEKIMPCSMILNNESFSDLLQSNKIYFSGSGALKFKDIITNKNAFFANYSVISTAMSMISNKKYSKQHFADVFYASPEYLKEFYSPAKVI